MAFRPVSFSCGHTCCPCQRFRAPPGTGVGAKLPTQTLKQQATAALDTVTGASFPNAADISEVLNEPAFQGCFSRSQRQHAHSIIDSIKKVTSLPPGPISGTGRQSIIGPTQVDSMEDGARRMDVEQVAPALKRS